MSDRNISTEKKMTMRNSRINGPRKQMKIANRLTPSVKQKSDGGGGGEEMIRKMERLKEKHTKLNQLPSFGKKKKKGESVWNGVGVQLVDRKRAPTCVQSVGREVGRNEWHLYLYISVHPDDLLLLYDLSTQSSINAIKMTSESRASRRPRRSPPIRADWQRLREREKKKTRGTRYYYSANRRWYIKRNPGRVDKSTRPDINRDQKKKKIFLLFLQTLVNR